MSVEAFWESPVMGRRNRLVMERMRRKALNLPEIEDEDLKSQRSEHGKTGELDAQFNELWRENSQLKEHLSSQLDKLSDLGKRAEDQDKQIKWYRSKLALKGAENTQSGSELSSKDECIKALQSQLNNMALEKIALANKVESFRQEAIDFELALVEEKRVVSEQVKTIEELKILAPKNENQFKENKSLKINIRDLNVALDPEFSTTTAASVIARAFPHLIVSLIRKSCPFHGLDSTFLISPDTLLAAAPEGRRFGTLVAILRATEESLYGSRPDTPQEIRPIFEWYSDGSLRPKPPLVEVIIWGSSTICAELILALRKKGIVNVAFGTDSDPSSEFYQGNEAFEPVVDNTLDSQLRIRVVSAAKRIRSKVPQDKSSDPASLPMLVIQYSPRKVYRASPGFIYNKKDIAEVAIFEPSDRQDALWASEVAQRGEEIKEMEGKMIRNFVQTDPTAGELGFRSWVSDRE